MFRYSNFDLVAGRQQEKAEKLLAYMNKHCSLVYSEKIDKILTESKASYSYLEGLCAMIKNHNDALHISCISREQDEYHVGQSLKKGFERADKDWSSPILYIEFSFPADYKLPVGYHPDLGHVYMMFFTHHDDVERSEESIIYYLTRFNKLKVFT